MTPPNPLADIPTSDLLAELDAQTHIIKGALAECDVIREELERRG